VNVNASRESTAYTAGPNAANAGAIDAANPDAVSPYGPPPSRVLLKIWLSILLLAVAAYVAYRIYDLTNSAAVNARIVLDPGPKPLPELAELALIERSGANFKFDRLNGHVWTANYFFTSCRRECLRITQVVKGLQDEFPELRLVSVTSDPNEDKPPQLAEYAKENAADPLRWFFLTGDASDVRRLSEILFALPIKNSDHSPRIAVIDRHGRLVETFNSLVESDLVRLRDLVRKLQAAPPDNPPLGKPRGE
jgi:protein SCO1/2